MYNQVIRRNPDNATLYIGRAETHLLAGHPSSADRDIERALKLDPQNPFIYMLRAWVKVERSDVNAAARDIEYAKALGYDAKACDAFFEEIKKKK